MRRRTAFTAWMVAAAALAWAAPSALAGPELSVSITRTTTPATKLDERLVQTVQVRNNASAKPSEGDVLTCRGVPADGVSWFFRGPEPSFEIEWLRNGEPIDGTRGPAQDSKTYTLTTADVGKSLQCYVRGSSDPDGSGTEYAPIVGTTVSVPPVVVEPAPSPPPPSGIGRPEIVGSSGVPVPANLGTTLFCHPPSDQFSKWSGTEITWTLQWLRNGQPIPGANSTEYVVAADDVDPPSSLTCKATATDSNGNRAVTITLGARSQPQPPAPYGSPATASAATVSFSNGTVGEVTVEVELPGGLETLGVTVAGTGWSCDKYPPGPGTPATARCTRADPLAPQESYPPIEMVTHVGNDAPDLLETGATVSGGGSIEDGHAEDVFGPLPPGLPFGFRFFRTDILNQGEADFKQAGGHPFTAGASLELEWHLKAENQNDDFRSVTGSPRLIVTDTPRGFVGNPQAPPATCDNIDGVIALPTTACPPGSVVGGITLDTGQGYYENQPVFAIEPEFGAPAQFGFGIPRSNVSYVLTPELRAEDGYAISLVTAPIQKVPDLFGADVTLCGFGGKLGIAGPEAKDPGTSEFKGCYRSSEAGAYDLPFLSLPTRCGDPAATTTEISADTWKEPGKFTGASFTAPLLEDCEAVDFEPEISLEPTANRADSPTGLDVELEMPTDGLLRPDGVAQANLANSVVTLPAGMSVNPSLAAGLGACTQAELGMVNGVPNNEPASCPESSKVGTVEIETPLLDQPLAGTVYVAKQGENPFGSLLALYLVVSSPRYGLTIKIAGKVSPDPVTGQLAATFKENPQAPFSKLSLHFISGERAPLINPPKCGTYRITTELSSWMAEDPANPQPSEVVSESSAFRVTRGPGGGPCPRGDLEPGFAAGLASPIAGSTSPFSLHLTRPDGSQRFAGLEVSVPQGLTAYLRGIPYCPEAALASISEVEGTGSAELASPSCPAASQVGTATVGAGAGAYPYYVDTGKAYLAGPYKGAPLSIAIVTPAVAGPFDLGSVVVRAGAYVNPQTAQITVRSDPIPRILHGILLDVRDIRVDMNRPRFMLAPTSCEAMAVSANVGGENGAVAPVSNRFQVGGCEDLGFKPKLNLRLKGGVKRGAHPKLISTLRARPGDANIGRAQVKLPPSAFLDQANIGTVCTRVQWAADACPKRSVYGRVRATTPLLDYPVTGKVYLRSSNHKLPDLVADLRGPAYQPIRVELSGRTDSVKGALRNTFDVVPDVPVTNFRLELIGGKRGLIVMSDGFCKRPRAAINLRAQNGRRYNTRPKVRSSCGKKAKRKSRAKRRAARR